MTLPFGLADVRRIAFYKRDEIATDLLCCDVEVDDPSGRRTWFNHEESDEWAAWLAEFETLPNFDEDWRSKVCQPSFALCVTVAYEREAVEPAAPKD